MKSWDEVEPDEYRLMNKNFTPNRSANGGCIKFIVIHHNAANLSIDDCWHVWQNREATAHYQVDINGRIGQLVNDRDIAWHAGSWEANLNSIGIEHADCSNNPWRVSDATLDNGAHLVAALCKVYRLGEPQMYKNVFPHCYFYATACPAPLIHEQMDEYMRRAKLYYQGVKPNPIKTVGKAIAANVSAMVHKSVPSDSQIHVKYALRQIGGGWLPEVTDFGGGPDGFAGNPCHSHDLLEAHLDGPGTLKYRVHVLGGNWLGWVDHADKNDLVNGVAGTPGNVIDGVQFYYVTPSGIPKRQAYYRSQTTRRAGWLKVCCDDGTSINGFDSFAGIFGEPLDRLQLSIDMVSKF